MLRRSCTIRFWPYCPRHNVEFRHSPENLTSLSVNDLYHRSRCNELDMYNVIKCYWNIIDLYLEYYSMIEILCSLPIFSFAEKNI